MSEEHVLTLAIEYSQHDDEFANGGWVFWVWLFTLARRDASSRGYVGYCTHQRKMEMLPVKITAEGVVEGASPAVSWGELEDALTNAEPWEEWEM